MKFLDGDLLLSNVPVIVHQCNCFHIMGSGIAKQLREKYPEVYEVDLKTKFGSKDKLGTFSKCEIKGEGTLKYVLNLYSQYGIGNGNDTDYNAIYEGMDQILYWCEINKIDRIGLPYMIGCGLGGGNSQKVKEILLNLQNLHKSVQIQIYKKSE